MKALINRFLAHPRVVMAVAVLIPGLLWGDTLLLTARRWGQPFKGFLEDGAQPNMVSYTSRYTGAGWQAGLRGHDVIVAVNGQPWSELQGVLRAVGVGGTVVYTVLRGSQTLTISVPVRPFDFYAIAQALPASFLFSAALVILGLLVYRHNPDGYLNRLILLYNCAWAVSNWTGNDWYFGRQTLSPYLGWPSGALACGAGWTLFWSFPADAARRRFLQRTHLIGAFWLFWGFVAISESVLMVLGMRYQSPQMWSLFGRVDWIAFRASLGSLIVKPVPLLLMSLSKDAPELLRRQARTLLLGVTPGLAAFYLINVLPYSNWYISPIYGAWSYILVLLYPLTVAYTVLRYQAFDMRVVIRRGLVYSILTAGLSAIFLVLSMAMGNAFQSWTGQQTFLAAVLPALVVAVMFRPAQTRVQTAVDRLFFRHEYEVRQTLTGFSRGLSTLRDQDEVTRLVLDTVTQTLGAEQATFWLLDAEHKAYRLAAQTPEASPGAEGLGELPAESEIPFTLFTERRALMLAPSDTSPQAVELHNLGAVLAVPLIAEQRLLLGFLTLGTKRSGLLYTDDDLDLLATLAQSATLALENARLHEERLAILRQQLAQVTAAQEEERQRIARELHDGVGPALASLNLRLRTAAKSAQPNPAAAEELKELAELTQANIQDIRRLIYDLRPAVLDELGLVAALREYVDRYEQEQGLQVKLSLPEGKERLPAPLETTLFRVIQEALTNAARHAKARHVEIALDWGAAQVTLRIADDGQGFDLRAADARAKGGQHLGLWSMRERIEQLGGRLDIQSHPGASTTIQATIPLAEGKT
jgi:signal transduction histidine kinase